MTDTISFCTTCMGRRHHLEAVYRRNLEIATASNNVEFILLDYNSPDNLQEWVMKELTEWTDQGILRYFRTEEPKSFHMARAKNVAHRLAEGNIVVNLDADNYYESGFVEELRGLFADGANTIAYFPEIRRGCMGRIAMRKDAFMDLGGYDEALVGWGFEDFDFRLRAEEYGLVYRSLDLRHAGALQHTNAERVHFTPQKGIRRNNKLNAARSEAARKAGKIVANAEREWGVVDLCYFHESK